MMRPTIAEMAGRMEDRGQKQGIPDVIEARRRRLRADFQRDGYRLAVVLRQQQMRIERVGDVVDVLDGDSRLTQAKIDGVKRQFPGREWYRPLAMLNVRETLFLGSSDDAAIGNEASGGVVKGCVDS